MIKYCRAIANDIMIVVKKMLPVILKPRTSSPINEIGLYKIKRGEAYMCEPQLNYFS